MRGLGSPVFRVQLADVRVVVVVDGSAHELGLLEACGQALLVRANLHRSHYAVYCRKERTRLEWNTYVITSLNALDQCHLTRFNITHLDRLPYETLDNGLSRLLEREGSVRASLVSGHSGQARLLIVEVVSRWVRSELSRSCNDKPLSRFAYVRSCTCSVACSFG